MIYVVFPNRPALDTFKADFPSTLVDPDTLIGEPAFEFTNEETGEVSGRCFVAHHFNAEETALLALAGAEVRVGGLDGPLYGSEESL